MFIYLIVNHENGKYYVGQHKGRDLKKYLQGKFYDARHDRGSSHLFNSMRKHPHPCNWSIHALLSDIQTKEELDQKEKEFIEFLRSRDPEYGYNLCKGGEGFTGKHTEEWKAMMRQKMTGRIFSSESLVKIKAAAKLRCGGTQPFGLDRKGKRHTPETLAKLRNKTISPVQRSQISTTLRRHFSSVEKRQWSPEVKDKIRRKRIKDLTGMIINGIEVKERVNTVGRSRWRCLCPCGKTFVVYSDNLQRGHTKSCGCLLSRSQT